MVLSLAFVVAATANTNNTNNTNYAAFDFDDLPVTKWKYRTNRIKELKCAAGHEKGCPLPIITSKNSMGETAEVSMKVFKKVAPSTWEHQPGDTIDWNEVGVYRLVYDHHDGLNKAEHHVFLLNLEDHTPPRVWHTRPNQMYDFPAENGSPECQVAFSQTKAYDDLDADYATPSFTVISSDGNGVVPGTTLDNETAVKAYCEQLVKEYPQTGRNYSVSATAQDSHGNTAPSTALFHFEVTGTGSPPVIHLPAVHDIAGGDTPAEKVECTREDPTAVLDWNPMPQHATCEKRINGSMHAVDRSHFTYQIEATNATSTVVIPETTALSNPGSYQLVYKCYDYADQAIRQNAADVHRKVVVVDTQPPVIQLSWSQGTQFVDEAFGNTWIEPGVNATDNCDGTVAVSSTWDKNPLTPDNKFRFKGKFIIFYTATDKFGNSARMSRTVIVSDAHKPHIILKDCVTNPCQTTNANQFEDQTIVEASNSKQYKDPGAICVDREDGAAVSLTVNGVAGVLLDQPTAGGDYSNWDGTGDYNVTYDCVASSGDVADQRKRRVQVRDSKCPELVLEGESTEYFERGSSKADDFKNTYDVGCNKTYDAVCDPMVTVIDNVDRTLPKCGDSGSGLGVERGCVTRSHTFTGFDNAVEGTYTFTYSGRDTAGNPQCATVNRTMIVRDTIPPVLHLLVANQPVEQVSNITDDPIVSADPIISSRLVRLQEGAYADHDSLMTEKGIVSDTTPWFVGSIVSMFGLVCYYVTVQRKTVIIEV